MFKHDTLHYSIIYFFLCSLLYSCIERQPFTDDNAPLIIDEDEQAVVKGVSVEGEERNYTFTVTLQSPDTGCEQYADWWEIVDPQFEFIYRRILTHSHVNEQPFSRSGGPVDIFTDEEVIIRGHMNNLGYGELVFRGSVSDGFFPDTLLTVVDISGTGPQPSGCEF